MEEDKWERYERERVALQPETQALLEQMTTALLTGSVDATVRLLLVTRTFSLQVTSMVETLQQRWQMSEPLEVVTELVRQACDREERDASLLTLMQELEVSGVADPVAYLADLVRKERVQRGEAEELVDYQMVPYSRLVGIHTPAALRERWRRAIWTIMMHNRACKRSEDRWYINVWIVAALAGGPFLALARYLEERRADLERHHQVYEIHPNRNRKPDAITASLSIAEDPPPEGGEAFWAQVDER